MSGESIRPDERRGPGVWTFGYQGWKVDDLKAVAERLDAVVVDIRLSANSKDASWARPNLQGRLGGLYLHVKALGNKNFRGDGPIELLSPASGMNVVREIVASGRSVILMCACWNFSACHRRVVSELVGQRLGMETREVTKREFFPPEPKAPPLPPEPEPPPDQLAMF